jgi:hypothetical protein
VNTYTAGTTVADGTLLVNGQATGSGTGTGAVMVGGATLGGTGRIGGPVTVVAGGVLAPGSNGPGTLTVNNNLNLTGLSAPAFLRVELNGSAAGQYDQVAVNGTVTLGGAFLSTITGSGFAPAQTDVLTLIDNDGADAVSGTFFGLPQGAPVNLGTYTATISYAAGTGNDVVLTNFQPVPEPGTVVAAGAAGLGLIGQLRRSIRPRKAQPIS